jgi:hypothetical protein
VAAAVVWSPARERALADAKVVHVPFCATVNGDVAGLHGKGWLTSDSTDDDGSPLFHAFRIYPFHVAIEAFRLRMTTSAPPERDRELETMSRAGAWKRLRTLNRRRPIGIVHGDVKPLNISVRSKGVVKAPDFGLAKLTGAGPLRSAQDEYPQAGQLASP